MSKHLKGKSTELSKPPKAQPTTQDYFTEATSWADDLYTTSIASRNRYRLAFYVAMSLCMCLAISVKGLVPLQHIEPFLVHHYEDGRVVVEPLKQTAAPIDQAEIESELVRYVLNRESYEDSSYHEQFSLITLMSSNTVSSQYMAEQSSNNKLSPINILANHGFRSVHVDNVVFLDRENLNAEESRKDQKNHTNLAQVSFTVTDHDKASGTITTRPMTALISWNYHGVSTNPDDRWRDWDGFNVTRYTTTERSL